MPTAFDDKIPVKSTNEDDHGEDSGEAAKPGLSVAEKEVDTPASRSTAPSPEPRIERPAPQGPAFQQEAEKNYRPKTARFWLIIASTFVATFIVALDRTILSTAIPQITNDFSSLGDIGWYGSSYMLTTAAFQLLFGRIYRFYDLRWTFLCCIVVFEVGSVICAAAPSSPIFILGRSIAGMGSAGIMTGSMMVIIPMVPLHKRPMFQAMFGLIFGVSSAVGPLIGGAFTEKASWRWCFWMNLPIGGVAFAAIAFLLKLEKRPRPRVSFKEHVMRLDPLGTFFFIPSMVCLVLALELGGSAYDWGNWRLIVLFVVFGVTGMAFGAVQVMMPDSASLPVRVIRQRTMWAGTGFMVCLSGAMFLCIYFLPLWLQTVKHVDPIDSGIYTLPLVLSLAIAAVSSSAFIQRLGYYVPSMLLGPCMMAVGEGLLVTLKPATASSHWIGFQFLVGFGLGCGMQTVGLAVQATMPREDIPTGIAITFWAQQLGGAVFVSVGQAILNADLIERVSHIPGLDAKAIVRMGATKLHEMVSGDQLDVVQGAYNSGCTRIFLAACVLSGAQLACACLIPWKSIKKGQPGPPGQGPPAQGHGQAPSKLSG